MAIVSCYYTIIVFHSKYVSESETFSLRNDMFLLGDIIRIFRKVTIFLLLFYCILRCK